MDFTSKILAKRTILLWMESKYWRGQSNLIAEISDFKSLEDFYEYIVVERSAPLCFLPDQFKFSISFLYKAVIKKPELINQIYTISKESSRKDVYQTVMGLLEFPRFKNRCKFLLLPEVRADMFNKISSIPKFDESIFKKA